MATGGTATPTQMVLALYLRSHYPLRARQSITPHTIRMTFFTVALRYSRLKSILHAIITATILSVMEGCVRKRAPENE